MRFTRTTRTAAVLATTALALCMPGLAVGTTASPEPSNVEPVTGDRWFAEPGRGAPTAAAGILVGDRWFTDLRLDTPPAHGDVVKGDRWFADVGTSAPAALPAQAVAEAASFDWRDAGIGALAALGAVSLLALGAFGLRGAPGERVSGPAS